MPLELIRTTVLVFWFSQMDLIITLRQREAKYIKGIFEDI